MATRSRRKKGAEAHESSERWLVSYADMITLLVVFFIILYAQSNVDKDKYSKLAVSFNQAFGGGGVMTGSPKTGMIVGEGGKVGQIEIATFQQIASEMSKFAEQQGITDDISVGARKEGLVIELSGNVLFPSGSAELRPKAMVVLDMVAALLLTSHNDIQIEAHTDDIPVASEAYPTNWELSSSRAVTVLRYLANKGGVPPERMRSVGYAEFRPLAPNDSRENRAKNRRVEIVLLNMEDVFEITSSSGWSNE